MSYKHGTYAEKTQFEGNLGSKSLGTIPAYIGTAPIQQLNKLGSSSFNYSAYINKPILLSSMADARSKIGYSDDWSNYSLGEAIKAHFENGVKNIGPIIVINVADPSELESNVTSATVTLSGSVGSKKGYINDPLAAIESIELTGLLAGDYSLSYEDDKILLIITKAEFTNNTIAASYKRIAINVTTTLFEQAIEALDYCEMLTSYIPNLLLAPGYSSSSEYHSIMINKALNKIGSKWYFTVLSDIPASSLVKTLDAAKTWKETNNYNSVNDKVCYPKVKHNSKIYHLSTMTAVKIQIIDSENDNVPYISPSNELLFAQAAVLDNGEQLLITEKQANDVNAVGITTVNLVKGNLRIWGPHMSNYNYSKLDDIDPEDRTDSSARMFMYIQNKLQYDYIDDIDGPIARRDIDSIKVDIQLWLNSLVKEGKLLYGTIDFIESNNSTAELVNGDFVFNVKTTTTPNGKSFTFKVQYSTEGISSLVGGEA